MKYSAYSNEVNATTYAYGLLSGIVEDATPTSIVLTFESELNDTLPAISAFGLVIPNKTIITRSLDGTKKILTLTTSASFVKGDAIIINYTKPVSNPLKLNAGGLEIISFEFVCTNNVIEIPAYTNLCGQGDRINLITLSTNITFGGTGDITQIINGSLLQQTIYFGTGQSSSGKYIKFDFGTGITKQITEAKWYQSGTGTETHGYWKWQVSNNDSDWTDIGNQFEWTGTKPQIFTELNGNTDFYRYYRLLGVSGTIYAGLYLMEMLFKIAGGSVSLIDWETIKQTGVNFWLIPSGNKTAVSTLILIATESFTITIVGTTKFYTNAGGTLGESSSWSLIAGQNTIYLKCNDDSVLPLPSNKITAISWASSTNAAFIFRDISDLIDFTIIAINGNNYIIGSLTNLTKLTTWYHTGNTLITGSITNATGLTEFYELSTINTINGNLTHHVNLLRFTITGLFTLNGDVTNLTKLNCFFVAGNSDFTGDISGFVDINDSLEIYGGISIFTGNVSNIINVRSLTLGCYNSVYGDLAVLTKAYWIYVGQIGNTSNVTCSGAINLKECGNLIVNGGNTYLSVTQVNQILADFWANRDEPHSYTGDRTIYLKGAQPTGQGIIDMAALKAYRTPNNNGAYNLWAVTVVS